MNAMQYTIRLPTDYAMAIIKNHVTNTAPRTDKLTGLLFKAYLISETATGALENSYAPLYLWNDNNAMTQLIFNGFYDKIIQSFGWQEIMIGIPYIIDLTKEFTRATHMLLKTFVIEECPSLGSIHESINIAIDAFPPERLGTVCIYTPEKWTYMLYLFYETQQITSNFKQYTVVHISKP